MGEAYREVIDSNLLLSAVKLPQEYRDRRVEMTLRLIPGRVRKGSRTPFVETGIRLNGYRFDREEANER